MLHVTTFALALQDHSPHISRFSSNFPGQDPRSTLRALARATPRKWLYARALLTRINLINLTAQHAPRRFRFGEPCDRQRVCQTSSYQPMPRVSTPGVGHFYAPFRDFSYSSAAHLGISIDPERAANHGPKSLRFLDALPPFGRKLSSPLPRRGVTELTPVCLASVIITRQKRKR
jgi:hypothetical protein